MIDPTEVLELARESTEIHSRLLRCTLAIDESRAYWERTASTPQATPEQAFEEFWFGAKSLPRIRVLLTTMRDRFDAFPGALNVLRRWRTMSPQTRALICHWHVQLTDSLYRTFTGDYLVSRHDALRPEVHRRTVVAWIAGHDGGRWSMSTRAEVASRLLSTALSTGLLAGRVDPRELRFPRVDDAALSYLLHLLHGIEFEGTLTANPYLRSVGLAGRDLERRLRALPSLRYGSSGDLVEMGWRYPDLESWADAELTADASNPPLDPTPDRPRGNSTTCDRGES